MSDHKTKGMSIIQLLRPQQWIKNVFVAAPLLFSGRFRDPALCLKTVLAFIAFSLISSAIYAVNDVCDREEDRRHPVKKNRPIASGRIGINFAILLSLCLLVIGSALSWYLDGRTLLMALIFIILQLAYSLILKHVAILDVMVIAGGFVMRILAGSVAITVTPSHWLVLCTIMISLFLGFTKRRAELITLGELTEHTRTVLKDYSTVFLDQVIAMVTGATIVCYALYTVDDHTLKVLGNRGMLLTVPSVIYGLFRYIYLIYHCKKGEDPTETVVRDIPTLVNLVLWVLISFFVVIYGNRLNLFQ